MKKVYYAHSMHLYNTPQEKRDIELLEKLGFEVLNPNNRNSIIEYEEWLKKNKISDLGKMEWFEYLVNDCDCVAYRSYVDLKIPSGVLFEVEYAMKINLPVFELPTITESRRMSIKETREYSSYNGQR